MEDFGPILEIGQQTGPKMGSSSSKLILSQRLV